MKPRCTSRRDEEQAIRLRLKGDVDETDARDGAFACCGLLTLVSTIVLGVRLLLRRQLPKDWFGWTASPLRPQNGAHDPERSLIQVRDLTPFIKFDGNRPFAISPCSDLYKSILLNEYVVVARRIRFQDDDDSYDEMLERTAERLMRARHINVLCYLGTCTFERSLCIVTPFAKGGDLAKYIAAHRDCDRKNLVIQVANGLEYLHQSGIVHGNLHPRNVLLSEDGIVKLSEFGLYEHIPDEGSTSMRPAFGREKAMHRAPEVHMGASIAPSSDVYSFGMLVFHMYCDKEPMIERYPNTIQVAAALMAGRRPERVEIARSDFSDDLWEMTQRCWAPDQEKRPSLTAGDLDRFFPKRISARISLSGNARKLL